MDNQSQSTHYLPAVGTWRQGYYLLDARSQDAIRLAVACGRPLLVRGLPGAGKSDLARAAAEYLQRAFVYEVITARTEPQDLLWRYDAVARLADAQAIAAGVALSGNPANQRDYVSPGVMWWAINWDSAERQINDHCKCKSNVQRPDSVLNIGNGEPVRQKRRAETKGCVVLLDEIDKADSELPNSMLEVLANTGFRLPWDGENEIKPDESQGANPPLIVITTNEDRELPPAFVRRCLAITLEPGGDFAGWIKDRARVHFREPGQREDGRAAMGQTVLDRAAELLMDDRKDLQGETHLPGLAEYLDLLRGLDSLARDNETEQLEWLKRVAGFAYQKRAPLSR